MTALLLAVVALAWNLSFYQELYIDHAAAGFRRDRAEVAPGDPHVASDPDSRVARAASASLADQGARADVPVGGEGEPTRGDDGVRRIVPGSGMEPGHRSVSGAAGGPEADPAVVEDVTVPYPNSDRTRLEGRRVNGLRDGEWVEYYPDGREMSRGSFLGDLRDGSWIEYFPSGRTKSQGAYRAGLREGSWKRWHENGMTLGEGLYRDGRRVESWTLYYTDGSVMESGRYVDGLREGFWTFLAPDGTRDDRSGWYEAGRQTDS